MFENKLHEECGVFGIFSNDKEIDVARLTYIALYSLQHRGQESCGITVNDDGVMNTYRDIGLVSEVFTKEKLESLNHGNIAIGHVRYSTPDASARRNAQPIQINHIKGSMSIAHNGNIINVAQLRNELEQEGLIFHSTSDTEIIAYLIARSRLRTKSIEESVAEALPKLEGAFSLVMTSPQKMIAARDPRGFKPLCIGMLDNSYIISSESCAINAVGGKFIRDVEAGEIVVIDKDGIRSIPKYCNTQKESLCVFEYIYFARSDSDICGTSVHTARKRLGALLAEEHPIEADVVIGVPDSGIDAAIGYAEKSGIPYGIGLIKNKYIGRTFIQPEQKTREDTVRIKLNAVSSTVKGKRVIMVDDSIVRGTTSARIVKILKEAGATEVHMRSSAPPFLYPCYFGTDIDSQDKLIACNYTMDEIKNMIGADTLGYLEIKDLPNILDINKDKICKACFDGVYPCDVSKVTDENKFKSKYAKKISEA
ncbi:amidophosphoribosyltransferase [Eubacteriales bacterium OttesenSCG-928-G02]|nr:amidophosphoribosyltransferase [Eubacteriales bacterium OttesenSCG-928-G02]